MGKFKLVLDVVEDMRALADSLEAVANVICENEVEDDVYEENSVVAKEEEAYKTDSEEDIKEVREISLEEVRAVLAKKSQAGFTDKIRNIIKSYGCEKLSEVDPKYYKDIMKKCEVFSSEE